MSPNRIRSVKPEVWKDEKVGRLSQGARLLFVGLVTMADDEGRLLATDSAILGHCFPYEPKAGGQLTGWMTELVSSGVLIVYTRDDLRYAAFRHWRRHQRINRPSPSKLPKPPNRRVIQENRPSRKGPEKFTEPFTERSVSAHCLTRACAFPDPDPDPLTGSLNALQEEKRPVAPAPAREAEHRRDLPPVTAAVLDVLRRVHAERGGVTPTERGVVLAVRAFPHRDYLAVALEVEHWALAGAGQHQQVLDLQRVYRAFLKRAPDGIAPKPARAPRRSANRESPSDLLRALDGSA